MNVPMTIRRKRRSSTKPTGTLYLSNADKPRRVYLVYEGAAKMPARELLAFTLADAAQRMVAEVVRNQDPDGPSVRVRATSNPHTREALVAQTAPVLRQWKLTEKPKVFPKRGATGKFARKERG